MVFGVRAEKEISMVSRLTTVDRNPHFREIREIVCIRVGEFSLIQGEAVWRHSGQACIRHLGAEITGPCVESVRCF